jgi:hypothetical protein
MKDNKIQMQNMLQEVVTQFGQNPNVMRAVNDLANCSYERTNKHNLGCAIGMFLDDRTAKKLERFDDKAISTFLGNGCKYLPIWLFKIDSSFLQSIQQLHDSNLYFDKKGFSKMGKTKIKDICKAFKLNYKEIKYPKYLPIQ